MKESCAREGAKLAPVRDRIPGLTGALRELGPTLDWVRDLGLDASVAVFLLLRLLVAALVELKSLDFPVRDTDFFLSDKEGENIFQVP